MRLWTRVSSVFSWCCHSAITSIELQLKHDLSLYRNVYGGAKKGEGIGMHYYTGMKFQKVGTNIFSDFNNLTQECNAEECKDRIRVYPY